MSCSIVLNWIEVSCCDTVEIKGNKMIRKGIENKEK